MFKGSISEGAFKGSLGPSRVYKVIIIIMTNTRIRTAKVYHANTICLDSEC